MVYGSDRYRGVSAVPAAVPAVLSDGARLGADAGGAAGRSRVFGGCCDGGAARRRTGRAINAGPLLHFHPDCLQAERRWRGEVTQVL